MNGHDNTDKTLIFMFMCWKDSVRNLIRVCPTDCGNVIQILPSGVRHSQINVLYFGVSHRDDDDTYWQNEVLLHVVNWAPPGRLNSC